MTEFIKAVRPEGKPAILMFDLGGILVRLNPITGIWANQTPDPGSPDFEERWSASRAVYDFETGRIADVAAFQKRARQELGFTVSDDVFFRIFAEAVGDLFEETLPLLSALRAYYPLALLSNTSPDHWIHCRDRQGLGGCFDEVFVSYELGVMKPDPRIFQQVLSRLQDNPENIWFFDDRQENVDAARKMGINGVLSFGGETLIDDLRNLGFLA